jgi:hypothetical protein
MRSPNLLAVAAAMLGLLSAPTASPAESRTPSPRSAGTLEAQFRGCDSAGWCRFWIESPDLLLRVRPDGVSTTPGDDAIRIAVRNRLNALLANMIHQDKHIVLHDLRELNDGTFAATVTVNSADVASDPVLLELQKKVAKTNR